MAKMLVSAEHKVDAPADVVYRYVADMREHHPHFLPPAFSDFRVESGGVGAGTITRFKMTAGGRTREYRMKVAEPEPGRILTESDTGSSAVTTFTISPQGGASIVRISTAWDGAGGMGGLFERMFAPRVLRAPSMPTNLSDSMRTRANIAQHESRPPCRRQKSNSLRKPENFRRRIPSSRDMDAS
jgi:Polyketide cyclase / dehydrase and lipid transport